MNGDRGSALWGELLSTAAQAHGATGAVIDGLTRDAAKIVQMDFPVFAAGFSPLDSKGRIDSIHHGRPIRVGECVVQSGRLGLRRHRRHRGGAGGAGRRGVPARLEKVRGENRVREELLKGRSVREVFAEYGIL